MPSRDGATAKSKESSLAYCISELILFIAAAYVSIFILYSSPFEYAKLNLWNPNRKDPAFSALNVDSASCELSTTLNLCEISRLAELFVRKQPARQP